MKPGDRALFQSGWVRDHWKLLFIGLPSFFAFLLALYILSVYYTWQGDREMALNKLARYKELIDRTEELKKGSVFTSREIDLASKVVDIPSRIYDRNGEIIGEFFEEKREIVPYDYIPRGLSRGVIASEDREFEHHRGVNPKGIFRALAVNLMYMRVAQGGSTITQQLSKVLFTDMERNMKRKIYEVFCALEIEKRYDKLDILSMYLNLIYFGNGAYGVESASRMFFGKSVRELDDVECAMIVGTISNPRVYSPLENLDNSVRKTRRILTSLSEVKYITPEKAEARYREFLKRWDVRFDPSGKAASSLIGTFSSSVYRVNRAPFFNERIRRLLVDKWGEDVLKKGGLSVYTTIDAVRQDAALRALRAGVVSQREYHMKTAAGIRDAKLSEEERLKAAAIEGALVSLDPSTGEVIAYVGGYEFSSRSQLDCVERIMRQPGSSFKPLVYAAALWNHAITPSTVMVDEKTSFGEDYSPENYGETFSGNIIMREALRRSVNVIAVKVLMASGYDRLMSVIQGGLNLSSGDMERRFGQTPSLALGTYELSPMENAVLHSMLVNGGLFLMPYGIRNIRDYNGNIVLDREAEIRAKMDERRAEGRIMDPAAAAVTVSMLRGVFEKGGTAYGSLSGRTLPFQIAGKTGTSTNFNDAWFVGYTSNLVTAVWIGNREGAISLGRGHTGGALAAPVWTAYTEEIYRNAPPPDFPLPENGLSRERICLLTGLVAGPDNNCPDVAEQLYLSGTEPGDYCSIHRKVRQGQQDILK